MSHISELKVNTYILVQLFPRCCNHAGVCKTFEEYAWQKYFAFFLFALVGLTLYQVLLAK
jgi:hypothetical protein